MSTVAAHTVDSSTITARL